jgi:hypothetical protein
VDQGLLHVFSDLVVVEQRKGVLDPIVLMCRLGCGDAQGNKLKEVGFGCAFPSPELMPIFGRSHFKFHARIGKNATKCLGTDALILGACGLPNCREASSRPERLQCG